MADVGGAVGGVQGKNGEASSQMAQTDGGVNYTTGLGAEMSGEGDDEDLPGCDARSQSGRRREKQRSAASGCAPG